jgi:transcription elongation factor Elf1
VEAVPRAIVRGADGSTTWVARCPRCWDHNDESVVTGTEGSARAQCAACGAIVEVRESGIFAASPTIPPPKE